MLMPLLRPAEASSAMAKAIVGGREPGPDAVSIPRPCEITPAAAGATAAMEEPALTALRAESLMVRSSSPWIWVAVAAPAKKIHPIIRAPQVEEPFALQWQARSSWTARLRLMAW